MIRIDRKIQPMPLFEQPFGGELGSYASDLTVELNLEELAGSFEWHIPGLDELVSGNLQFDKTLAGYEVTDYDGCFSLPGPVKDVLAEHKISTEGC